MHLYIVLGGYILICSLTCICLCQISLIQTCLRVFVGPGFVSTSSAFMRSSTSHPAGAHDCLAQKRGGRGRHNLRRVCHTTVRAPSRVGCVFWSYDVPLGDPEVKRSL